MELIIPLIMELIISYIPIILFILFTGFVCFRNDQLHAQIAEWKRIDLCYKMQLHFINELLITIIDDMNNEGEDDVKKRNYYSRIKAIQNQLCHYTALQIHKTELKKLEEYFRKKDDQNNKNR
jgi:hypothetical protein